MKDFNLLIEKYLDENISEDEMKYFKNLLKNEHFKREFEKTSKLRNELRTLQDQSFSPFFEEKVLNRLNIEIGSENKLFEYMINSSKKVLVPALTIIVLLFILNIFSSNDNIISEVFGTDQPNIQTVYINSNFINME